MKERHHGKFGKIPQIIKGKRKTMKKVSKAAYQIEGQPMFKLLARVQEMERQGRNIVHFEIGDPDFRTPENIVEAACLSIKNGETHYTSSMGLFDMRVAACDATEHSRGFRPKLEQVLVTPGANIIIYYAIRCLVEPGEEVIVPDPGFPTYFSAIKFCDVVPVKVPLKEENEFRMNPQDIRQKITEKTRLIIINSPQNPTGSVMTRKELDEVYDIAEEFDIYLLCDEVYARMIYDETQRYYSPSIRDACHDRTILANGFSKAFAMTGWRLGCVIGPEIIIDKMGLLLQTTSSCVSPFIQRAGIEAIRGPQDNIRDMMKEYRERRNLLVDGLNSIPGVKCLRPGGAFYVFPNIKETGMSDETFSNRMLEEAGVALLPGSNFGEYGKGYVRLCYATNKDNIIEGLSRMKKLLEKGN
jgi:aspartate/methionine/tyrosine aminotransferase